MRRALAIVLAMGIVYLGLGCTSLGAPQITAQLRQSCFWVDDVGLTNALAVFAMDKDAGSTAQEEVLSFTNSCISACVANGGDNATCTYNCTNCGTAIAAEVFGY